MPLSTTGTSYQVGKYQLGIWLFNLHCLSYHLSYAQLYPAGLDCASQSWGLILWCHCCKQEQKKKKRERGRERESPKIAQALPQCRRTFLLWSVGGQIISLTAVFCPCKLTLWLDASKNKGSQPEEIDWKWGNIPCFSWLNCDTVSPPWVNIWSCVLISQSMRFNSRNARPILIFKRFLQIGKL